MINIDPKIKAEVQKAIKNAVTSLIEIDDDLEDLKKLLTDIRKLLFIKHPYRQEINNYISTINTLQKEIGDVICHKNN